MAEKIKEHKDTVFFVSGIGLIFIILGLVVLFQMGGFSNSASAATTTEVTVSATVQEWITLEMSTTSITLSPDLLDTSGNLNIASSGSFTAVVSTNAAGYSLSVSSENEGLATGSYYIYTVDATATLATGTDGYGLNATSTEGIIQANYDYWGTDTVGEATSTAATISSTSTAVTYSTTTVDVKAACDASQEADEYTDTLTFTATGSS